jgi:hypothetical protein
MSRNRRGLRAFCEEVQQPELLQPTWYQKCPASPPLPEGRIALSSQMFFRLLHGRPRAAPAIDRQALVPPRPRPQPAVICREVLCQGRRAANRSLRRPYDRALILKKESPHRTNLGVLQSDRLLRTKGPLAESCGSHTPVHRWRVRVRNRLGGEKKGRWDCLSAGPTDDLCVH